MFKSLFWKDAVERAVSTAAQAAVALLGADALNLLNVNWQETLGVSAGAAFLSLLKAVAAVKLTDDTVSPASLASRDTDAL